MFYLPRHSVAQAWLTEARRIETTSVRFRELVRRLGALLAWEALREAPQRACRVETPCGVAEGGVLAERMVIVPILRAGLIYGEGMAKVFPEAAFGHIGLYRDEQTHRPVPYFTKLPAWLGQGGEPVRVLLADPMLATGHSAVAAADELLKRGVKAREIMLLTMVSAPEGRAVFEAAHPEIALWTWALDERLNERAYIVPGLGDAGDRLFGTV